MSCLGSVPAHMNGLAILLCPCGLTLPKNPQECVRSCQVVRTRVVTGAVNLCAGWCRRCARGCHFHPRGPQVTQTGSPRLQTKIEKIMNYYCCFWTKFLFPCDLFCVHSMVPAGGPGAPTGRVSGTGGIGLGGALQEVLGGRGGIFKKVHFPVARL